MYLALSITVLLALCSSFGTAQKYEELKFMKENISDVGREVSQGVNKLTLQFLKHVKSKEGTMFISPVSIATSLGMLYLMTEGETAEEISKALSVEQTSFAEGFHDLLNSLKQNETMLLANKVYSPMDFPLKQSYLDEAEKHLGAEAGNINFNEPEEARKEINSWTSNHTGQKINELFPSGSLTSDTRLVLVSTVFFNGTWHYPFPVKTTKKRDFTLADGSKKKTWMMRSQKRLGYAVFEDLKAKVLHLPYKDAHQSFIIVLPDEYDGLKEVEEKLIEENRLNEIIDINNYTKVKATIPKFKIKQSVELRSTLEKIGLKRIFDRGLGDFSKAVDHKGLSVSLMQHSACVELNEKGTIASGASGTVLTMRSAFGLGVEVPEFLADHPFLFFISDNPSRSILFAGRFTSPPDDED